MSQEPQAPYGRSDLFLVRLWTDQSGGEVEWRGWVQRAVDGERLHFSSRASLMEVLLTMLPAKARSTKAGPAKPNAEARAEGRDPELERKP